jgi:hypothetical protein
MPMRNRGCFVHNPSLISHRAIVCHLCNTMISQTLCLRGVRIPFQKTTSAYATFCVKALGQNTRILAMCSKQETLCTKLSNLNRRFCIPVPTTNSHQQLQYNCDYVILTWFNLPPPPSSYTYFAFLATPNTNTAQEWSLMKLHFLKQPITSKLINLIRRTWEINCRNALLHTVT